VAGERSERRFPIRVGRRSRPLLLLFGVTSNNVWVDLNGVLESRFGFFRIATPIENVISYRIEGPWLWVSAIGVRMSLRHHDLTFGGSPHGGVRLNFRRPVRLGPLRIPALYVTVDDLEGLATALAARGIPGEDARKQKVP
jgi:hypothetical protein